MTTVKIKRIVFCTDFSENADHAFEVAKDLAWRYGARLDIVHVMMTFSMAPVREMYVPLDVDAKFVEEATENAKTDIETHYVAQLKEKQSYHVEILSGYPATEIKAYAEREAIDLIVMGSHGLTGLAHVIFGSTADRVVRKSPCSVLTVRMPRAEGDKE